MRALLTVTHHDGIHESYLLECPHGSTDGEAAATPIESRERYVAGLLARHGVPYDCTCAAETDLVDVYPSIESAMEQIADGAGHGIAELDAELNADLVEKIKHARCPECSIGVRVLPFHLPLVVVPTHAPGCPRAEAERAT
jgi:hypothetical protein